MNLQELQLLNQLVDNMNILSDRVEKAYSSNDAESFNKAKTEILSLQKRINEIVTRSERK